MATNDSDDIFDPKDDYIFKKIFGHKENIFINFVNSVFKDKNERIVKSVTFVNTEITKDIILGKQGRLDVKATLDDGSHINIEIQVKPGDNFKKRSLFYWSDLYKDQLKKGKSYADLQRCVCINVVNFELFKNKDKFHTVIGGLDIDTHEWVLPEFEIHYLEVQKLKKVDYNTMNLLEKWILFLQAPKTEVLEELAMSEPMIAEAKETLYYLSHDEKERAIYKARKKYELDQMSEVQAARMQEKLEIARSLKALGVSSDTIVKASGLTLEQIEQA
ncbi:MAG: Rpn family recombination-promoting nuclease/putative transposase [Bdellovibrionota bacterium]